MTNRHSLFSFGKLVILLLTILSLSACGSGKRDGNSNITNTEDEGGSGSKITFNGAASGGELLTYILDTKNLTYSYKIEESQLGFTNQSNNGTLQKTEIPNVYIPSSDSNARVVLLSDKFVVGGFTVGGQLMTFAGVPKLNTSYTPADISGTYNFIEYAKWEGKYQAWGGTFKVNTNGTWEYCEMNDIDTVSTSSCKDHMTGTWTDKGGGLIDAQSQGLSIGTAMVLPGSSKGQILVIDLKDVSKEASDVAGPGMIVGIKKIDISKESFDGEYEWVDT
ncbi:MAG: hypothetical protein ACE5H1_11140, partial [Thermodesulfobacteriota bacterium]